MPASLTATAPAKRPRLRLGLRAPLAGCCGSPSTRARARRTWRASFDVPLPTVHHVLSTLAQEGLLEKDAAGRYHMGRTSVCSRDRSCASRACRASGSERSRSWLSSTGRDRASRGLARGEIRILAGVEGKPRRPRARHPHRLLRPRPRPRGREAAARARAAGAARRLPCAASADGPDRQDDHQPGWRLRVELDRIAGGRLRHRQRGVRDGLACLSVAIIEGGAVVRR